MRIVASTRPVWTTFGVALGFHVLLLSLQASHPRAPGFVRTWLVDTIAPVEKAVDSGAYSIGGLWGRYFALVGVRDENARLRTENDNLRMKLEEQSEEVLEAARLRAFLDLKKLGKGKTVAARVIGRDPSRPHKTVTIDKGVEQGIRPDAAVITAEGVVGRVIYSSGSYAVVQLVVDSQSAIAAMVQSTRVQGVFKGTGGSELQLHYIDDDTQIMEGDILITSGLDQIYPKGLAVGTVTTVGPAAGMFKQARIRPAVDLGRLEEVLCVIEHPPVVPDPFEAPSAPLPSE